MSFVNKDGTVAVRDVIQAIGKRIGVDFDPDKIIKDVKENLAKLEKCSGPHIFRKLPPRKALGERYACAICGGEVEGSAHRWYQRGLEHGKK